MASIATKIIDITNKPLGDLDDKEKRWSFPKLQKLNKNGRVNYWQIFAELFNEKANKIIKIKESYFNNETLDEDIVGRYYTISGLEEGKETESEYTIIESGKNLGKINQTNVLTQTLMSARTIYNKYLNKYSEYLSKQTLQLFKPMLAYIYDEKRIHFKKENVYLQSKLDGLRMVYHNNILYSRELKIYPGKEYIKTELNSIILPDKYKKEELYLDGELYKHGISLQEINSLGRKDSPDTSLEYHIYDCFIPSKPNLSYDERLELLNEIAEKNNFKNVKIINTHKVNSFEEIEIYYKEYLSNNYEGVIIRLGNSKYAINKRSYHLLKYKPVLTEEFIVIDVEDGKGKNKGVPLFTLSARLKAFKERINESEIKKYKDLKLFKASLKNYTTTESKQLYSELTANNKQLFYEKYYLSPAVCTFLNYSNDGIPRSTYITSFLLD